MSEDQSLSLLMAVMMLVLVASGLFARRIPMGNLMRMFLIWIGIFATGFVLFSFRGELGQVWGRVKSELSPGGSVDANGTLRVRKGEDGHFWLDAELNGRETRLMVDSGATTTALSMDTAKAVGIDVSDSRFPVIINTANGAVEARRAKVKRLRVGPIVREDFSVVVSEAFGDINVIGMNFLSTLEGWRVQGDELLLNPQQGASPSKVN